MQIQEFECSVNTFNGGSVYFILPHAITKDFLKGKNKAKIKALYDGQSLLIDLKGDFNNEE
jgi:hypothetical protein